MSTSKNLEWWEQAQLTGEIGEIKAIKYLEKNGFKVLKRSPKECWDIIAKRDNKEYAIQVKTGTSAIDKKSVKRLIEYSMENRCYPLLLFTDGNDEFFIFNHIHLGNTVSSKELKKFLNSDLVESVEVRFEGGGTTRWQRIT